MVAVRADENLRLVFKPAKGRGVDNAVPVALELRARQAPLLGKKTPARGPWIRGENRPLATSETQCALVYNHSSTCTVLWPGLPLTRSPWPLTIDLFIHPSYLSQRSAQSIIAAKAVADIAIDRLFDWFIMVTTNLLLSGS
jgi:hypothetical protein